MSHILPGCVAPAVFDDLEARRPKIQSFLEANLASEISNGRTLSGRFLYYNGWKSINLQAAFKVSIFAVMAQIYFGEMATEPEFAAALSRYPRDQELSAFARQYFPRIIAPAINFMMTRNESAKQTLIRRLMVVIDQSKITKVPVILHSLSISARSAEGALYQPTALADTILTMWLNASNQSLLVLVHTIARACTRILEGQRIQRGIGDQDQRTYDSLNNLPLLNKFMMEAIEERSLIQSSISKDLLTPELHEEFSDPMDPSLPDMGNGDPIVAAKMDRPYVLLAAKITVSHFLTNFNVRIAEETSLHLKDGMGKILQASDIRVIVRDRNYIEEDYL